MVHLAATSSSVTWARDRNVVLDFDVLARVLTAIALRRRGGPRAFAMLQRESPCNETNVETAGTGQQV